MSDKDIQNILQELYSIDPELKKHELELKQVITKFIAAKPKAEVDQSFKQELRAELLKKAEQFKPLPQEDMRGFSWAKLFTVRNFAYATISTALVVAIMIFAFNRPGDTPVGPTFTGGLSIEKLSSNAFGDLQAQDLLQASEQGAFGRGGGGQTTGTPAPDTGQQITPPGAVNYNYVYEGEITVDQANMDVLKKVTGDKIAAETSGLLDLFGLGMVNLKSFTNTSIQNITLTQDKDYGYNIEVNMAMGTVSISEVWDRWYDNTQDREPPTEADVPADAELIALADNFIKEHHVNLEAYGQPQVRKNWQEQLMAKEFDIKTYIPESIQVLYPLLINEKNVYLPGGEQTGLYVNINILKKKVTGLNNLAIQKYQSAPYTTMQDIAAIKEQIAKGGLYGYKIPGAAKTVNITLNDPNVHYVVLSKFEANIYTEFLVPALIFPVTDLPEDQQSSKQNVVVPLITDFFTTEDTVTGVPEPDIAE